MVKAPYYNFALLTRNITITRKPHYSMSNSRYAEGFMQSLFLGFHVSNQSFLAEGETSMLWVESGQSTPVIFLCLICPCNYIISNYLLGLLLQYGSGMMPKRVLRFLCRGSHEMHCTHHVGLFLHLFSQYGS